MSHLLYLVLTVTDPKTISEDSLGTTTHVRYKVTTSTNRPAFPNGQLSVSRRFKDFEWLSEQLGIHHAGIIIPPLPEKQAFGNMAPEFVEVRRRALEHFIQRISHHPILIESRPFIIFLTADDTAFAIEKAKALDDMNERQNAGMITWFDSTISAVTGNAVVDARMPSDSSIDNMMDYLNNMELHMAKISDASKKLVKRRRDISKAYLSFSGGLHETSETEGLKEGNLLAKGIGQMSGAAGQMSITSSGQKYVKIALALITHQEE